jgi:molecular chaperone DnaK (HSP70)
VISNKLIVAMSARHKVSVGIDYGTTFSGIAFVTSQRSDVKDIEVVNDWPDGARATEYLEKVPSQIAYARDNIKHNLDDDRWGYGVEPGMLSYCWTKLLLDARTAATNYDDPSLKEAAGGAGLRVPPGKSPVDVVTDYLKHLYKHCMDRLERKLTKGLLDASPIEFWFTMPAIWSDEAQFLTRKAAKDAGFGTRPLDSINMITEPEAAALAAFKTTKDKFDDLLVVCFITKIAEEDLLTKARQILES